MFLCLYFFIGYFSSDIFRCFILSVCITACTSVTCLLNINQSINQYLRIRRSRHSLVLDFIKSLTGGYLCIYFAKWQPQKCEHGPTQWKIQNKHRPIREHSKIKDPKTMLTHSRVHTRLGWRHSPCCTVFIILFLRHLFIYSSLFTIR